jgi:hypothetical protein
VRDVHLGDLVLLSHGKTPLGEALAQHAADHSELPPHGHVVHVELAENHRIPVHMNRGLLGCDAGMVQERRAEHQEYIGLVHKPRSDGGATPSEYADSSAAHRAKQDGHPVRD